MQIKKFIFIFFIFCLICLFSSLNKTYASVGLSFSSSPPSSNKVDDGFCGGILQQCWNSQSIGATDCGTACPSNSTTSTWSKYEYSGCYSDPDDLTSYFAWLPKSSIACSTGDKYNSGSPPIMDAGLCNATANVCNVGGQYKTCCSGGVPVAARSFQVDPFSPNEADCGGNTEVRCGGPGEPACGAAACVGEPTLTPTSTPTPQGPSCTCTYPESCDAGSGAGSGARSCNGVSSGGSCVFDSSGACSSNCSVCTLNAGPTQTPAPTNTPTPTPTCSPPTDLSGNCDPNLPTETLTP